MKTIWPHTTFQFRGRKFHYSGPGETMTHRALIALLTRLSNREFDSCYWCELSEECSP
jgi:hypothetical protein